MKMGFSVEEGRVLHGLIEDASGDIVVRLDPAGFIVHASQNAAELGMDLSSLLLMPHIADFADADHGHGVTQYVAKVFAGEVDGGSVEFPVRLCRCDQTGENAVQMPRSSCDLPRCKRWYALSVKLLDPDNGSAQGAIGLLRCVDQKHSMQGEYNALAATDPATGLANRHAFFACLNRQVADSAQQTLAVFAVDGLRAVFMQYGQRTADEIQWGFAKFLQTMTLPQHELAQLDGDRFAVLLKDMGVKQARVWTQDVLETFADLTVTASTRKSELTASAGLTPVEVSADWTMRQAELGLIMARAGGGKQIGICNQTGPAVTSGAAVERAMQQAIARAAERQV